MDYPIIITGRRISRRFFQGTSLFYPHYSFQVSDASQLDVASAIGAARRAESSSLIERRQMLERVASLLEFHDHLVEHVVRMTGMPISLIRETLEDIRRVFRQVPLTYQGRFGTFGVQDLVHQETVGSNLTKLIVPTEGFCYAVTPGIDPRASAIVAANLGYLGIPFILRASIRDAVAPLIIEAMLAAGFDMRFCSLLYLDRDTPDFEAKHFKILDACSCIWTFGPSDVIDRTLRYQVEGEGLTIDLQNYTGHSLSASDLKERLEHLSSGEFEKLVQRIPQKADHFEGKIVIRHESGNCAAILSGEVDDDFVKVLYPAIGYANVCTSIKSLMVVGEHGQIEQLGDYLGDLVVGDPLLEETQVGYIDPRNLDHLADLVRRNSLHICTYGGGRLSPHQARPLLVTSQEDLPDFLGQEIPAYVLAVRTSPDVKESVFQLNKHLQGKPRLGVSLFNIPSDQLEPAIGEIQAHIILIDKPTSILLPALHEGNDYAMLLTRGKIISG